MNEAENRIQQNMLGALGPFEAVANAICYGQRNATNSALYGLSTDPTPILKRCDSSPIISSTSHYIQKMKNLADSPVTKIKTNYLSDKLKDKNINISSLSWSTPYIESKTTNYYDNNNNSSQSSSVQKNNASSCSDVRKRDTICTSDSESNISSRLKKTKRYDDEVGKQESNKDKSREDVLSVDKFEAKDGQNPCSSGIENKIRENEMVITKTRFLDEGSVLHEQIRRKDCEKFDSDRGRKSNNEEDKNVEIGLSIPDFGFDFIKEVAPLLSPPRQPSAFIPKVINGSEGNHLPCVLDISSVKLKDGFPIEKLRLNAISNPHILKPLLSPSRPSLNGHLRGKFEILSSSSPLTRRQLVEPTPASSKSHNGTGVEENLYDQARSGSVVSTSTIRKIEGRKCDSGLTPKVESPSPSNFGERDHNASKIKVKNANRCKEKDSVKQKCEKSKIGTVTANYIATEKMNGVSQNLEESRCCSERTLPTLKYQLVKNEDGSFKSHDFYKEEIARTLKRQADKECNDRVRQVLFYFESVVYFILSIAIGVHRNRNQTNFQSQYYNMIQETADLLKSSCKRFSEYASQSTSASFTVHFLSRIDLLSSRTQAVLNFHLFNLRSEDVLKTYGTLMSYEKQYAALEKAIRNNNSSEKLGPVGSQSVRSAATPSPASSTQSANNDRRKEITIDLKFYDAQRSQVKNLNHLFWAHHMWRKSNAALAILEQNMVMKLDEICGRLIVDSDLFALSEYLATGVHWLLDEYEMEKSLTCEKGT